MKQTIIFYHSIFVFIVIMFISRMKCYIQYNVNEIEKKNIF